MPTQPPPKGLDLVTDLAAMAVLAILPVVLVRHLISGLIVGLTVLVILRLRTEPHTVGWRLLLATTAFVFAFWTLR